MVTGQENTFSPPPPIVMNLKTKGYRKAGALLYEVKFTILD